ncbi:MAG: CDP-diacylglycerol--glycerol-3-phosphate 3-phosphatidyltransferase, partial [uncultured Nocardioides sp.]
EHARGPREQLQRPQRPDGAAHRARAVLRLGAPAGRRRLHALALGGLRDLRGRDDHRQDRRRPRPQARPGHRLRQDRRPDRRQGDHGHGVHRPLDRRRHLVVGHHPGAGARVVGHAAAALGAQARRPAGQPERQDQDDPAGRGALRARLAAPARRRPRRQLRRLGPVRRGPLLPQPGGPRGCRGDDDVVGLRVLPRRLASARRRVGPAAHL